MMLTKITKAQVEAKAKTCAASPELYEQYKANFDAWAFKALYIQEQYEFWKKALDEQSANPDAKESP